MAFYSELVAHLDDFCIFHWLFVLIIPRERRVQQCTIFWLWIKQMNWAAVKQGVSTKRSEEKSWIGKKDNHGKDGRSSHTHRRNIVVSQQSKVVDRLISLLTIGLIWQESWFKKNWHEMKYLFNTKLKHIICNWLKNSLPPKPPAP